MADRTPGSGAGPAAGQVLRAVQGTDLFVAGEHGPCQVVRVELDPRAAAPGQVFRVRVEGPGVTTPAPVLVTVPVPGGDGDGRDGSGTERAGAGAEGRDGHPWVVEVPVTLAEPVTEGAVRRVDAVLEALAGNGSGAGPVREVLAGQLVAAVPGWTMWMVSHFHYDPVWWNSQSGFTQAWADLPVAEAKRPPICRSAFDLLSAHLDTADADPDYRFVLAELDYLKPHGDVHPRDRDRIRRLLAQGRLELVGGMSNEPNTNLTHPESTARNLVYGVGYQRDVLGGDPRTAWQLDVFGHDPAFPGLVAQAGLDSSAWARGPFHMVGTKRHTGDITRMQFPSEFDWLSPGGRGVLTHYMADHYVAGWQFEVKPTLEEALADAYREFGELRQVAATRNVMLPVGHDHNVPSRWCTQIHRTWPQRYLWPRFRLGLPRDFFAAVRAETGEPGPSRREGTGTPCGTAPVRPAGTAGAASGAGEADAGTAVAQERRARRRRILPQTRDMNPVFTGKDVSYVDTKQAQRAGEVAVLEAERFATLAWLLGRQHPDAAVEYPALALDKAWRQLLYGAHHDAVTGTESDQVYLDLLGGWREAFSLGDEVRAAALDRIADQVDTTGPGLAVLVANGLSWQRDAAVTVHLDLAAPGTSGLALQDDAGRPVPAVTEALTRHPDGTLAGITLTALVRDLPALGYRVYRAVPADRPPDGWHRRGSGPAPRSDPGAPTAGGPASGSVPGPSPTPTPAPADGDAEAFPTIANEALLLSADPSRGGALCRVLDRRNGRELLRPGGLAAEAYLQTEHPKHPVWEEGPWHLLPTGPGRGLREVPAQVHVETSPIGSRLVAVAQLDELRLTQQVTLLHGAAHAELTLHVDGSIGSDRLLRTRFEFDLPGALPVAEVGYAVVGRSVGFVDVDTAEHQWTLDAPALTWAGLSATARIALHRPDGTVSRHAIGVAEVVAPDDVPGAATDLDPADDPADELAAAVRDLVVRLAGQGVTATCTRPDGPRYGALDADSNLPDVRIVLGTDHALAHDLLDTLDPGERDAVRRALRATGRVFLPAATPRKERWVPGADLRGVRDLPVLLVDGGWLPAAVRELAADLDDATVDVALPEALPGTPEPCEDYSVAVTNTGTPGTVVDPDGTLHVSLMRSCSGWPCGVWIEGEPRTAPDGSSFAWQHWSHTFRLRLLGGAGDWRDAGFVRAGHEANHPPVARVVPTGPGPLPAVASLVTVEPESVALTLLKPRGNPLAGGLPGRPEPRDGVAVRLYETRGRAATARVRVAGTAGDPVRCDLLEVPGSDPADGTGSGPGTPAGSGAAPICGPTADLGTGTEQGVPLAPAEVVTLALASAPGTAPASPVAGRSGAAERPDAVEPVLLGPEREPVQPVHSRYWLHNLGAAPIGYVPVSVHAEPAVLTLRSGDGPDGSAAGEVVVTVAAANGPATGTLQLEVPAGLAVGGSPARRYELSPGGYVQVGVPVRVDGARPGRYLLAARITDELGQTLEDTVEVVVAEPGAVGVVGVADAAGIAGTRGTAAAGAAEADPGPETAGPQPWVDVAFGPERLAVRPGGRGELTVTLTGRASGPVHGQVLLLSPHGSWGAAPQELHVGPPCQGFEVGPGSTATLTFPVTVPPGARPGTRLWALAKVVCGGRVGYSSAVDLLVEDRSPAPRR